MGDNFKDVVDIDAEDPKSAKKSEDFVKAWLSEIDAAYRREKDYRHDAEKVVCIYEADRQDQIPFNILFSNTETLAPALYNATPRPIVQRRFKDEDPIGKVSSMVGQRTLEFLIDSNGRNYASFDDLMQVCVLNALVPGRGVLRFKYEADFVKKGEEGKEYDEVTGEMICGELIPWDRFNHGYAKVWEEVPWVSFTHFMTRDEMEEAFGRDIASTVKYSAVQETKDSGEKKVDVADDESRGANLACVHEIWDKTKKEVIFISPGKKDRALKKVDDPLQLSGFFPCPKPLQMFGRLNSLMPIPLYQTYRNQAEELNRVTTRIQKIVQALKVRGFYDSSLEGLEKVLNAEDNELVPVENAAAMQNGQTLEKSIWLMPLDKLITALQQLYLQRQQVKQVIYEITGIADIMRGSTVASETLGAQEIKNQWGTLRLKRMQKSVSRLARDGLRIMMEIAVTKLSPKTLEQITGINLPDDGEKQQAQMLLQQQALMGQQPSEDLIVAAGLPSWEEVIAMLRNDTMRQYRIDIETNSTVDAEATEDKQNVSEFLNAMAQFFNGVAPLVESGALPFEAARGIMLAVTRRFRFGTEVEDELKKMVPPKPQGESEGAAEQEAMAAQTAIATEKSKQETLRLEAQLQAEEHKFKMEEIQRKSQLSLLQHQMKLEQVKMQAAAANAAPKKKPNQNGD